MLISIILNLIILLLIIKEEVCLQKIHSKLLLKIVFLLIIKLLGKINNKEMLFKVEDCFCIIISMFYYKILSFQRIFLKNMEQEHFLYKMNQFRLIKMNLTIIRHFFKRIYIWKIKFKIIKLLKVVLYLFNHISFRIFVNF